MIVKKCKVSNLDSIRKCLTGIVFLSIRMLTNMQIDRIFKSTDLRNEIRNSLSAHQHRTDIKSFSKHKIETPADVKECQARIKQFFKIVLGKLNHSKEQGSYYNVTQMLTIN